MKSGYLSNCCSHTPCMNRVPISFAQIGIVGSFRLPPYNRNQSFSSLANNFFPRTKLYFVQFCYRRSIWIIWMHGIGNGFRMLIRCQTILLYSLHEHLESRVIGGFLRVKIAMRVNG